MAEIIILLIVLPVGFLIWVLLLCGLKAALKLWRALDND